jgi:hypothetical protein
MTLSRGQAPVGTHIPKGKYRVSAYSVTVDGTAGT